MKIEKYFDKQLKRECWRIDVTIAGQRFRAGKFPAKATAEKAIAAMRLHVIARRYGLPTQPVVVTVGELLAELENHSTRPAQGLPIASPTRSQLFGAA